MATEGLSVSAFPAIPMDGRLLCVDEVAAYFRVGVSTLYEGIDSGRFPKPKNFGGRTTRWLLEDIQQFARDQAFAGEREMSAA